MSRITNDPLVAFLYELTRDHAPLHAVSEIIDNDNTNSPDTPWCLEDDSRAFNCENLATTLRRLDPLPELVPPKMRVKA
jgi:hypothetical protein